MQTRIFKDNTLILITIWGWHNPQFKLQYFCIILKNQQFIKLSNKIWNNMHLFFNLVNHFNISNNYLYTNNQYDQFELNDFYSTKLFFWCKSIYSPKTVND